MTWIWRNMRMFKNWYAIYLWGEKRLRLRNGLIINILRRDDICIIWEVIGERCYGNFPQNAQIIVDIGANIGTFTLLALKETNAKIYAFEPVPENYALLMKNIKENDFENRAIVEKKAVAGTATTRKIFIPVEGDSGHSSFFDDKSGRPRKEISVECTTIDSILNSINFADIIKIDTEGSEQEIIESCTMKDKVGIVVTEEPYEGLVKKYFPHA